MPTFRYSIEKPSFSVCLFLLLILGSCLQIVSAQPADFPDDATSALGFDRGNFRLASWGMPEVQVMELEPARLEDKIEFPLTILGFRGRLLERPCRIVYWLLDDRLAAGYYLLEGDGLPGEFLELYKRLGDILTAIHGTPSGEDVLVSSRNQSEIRQLSVEDALWFGYTQHLAWWNLPPTRITLSIRSFDGAANLKVQVLYESLLLKPLVEKARKP